MTTSCSDGDSEESQGEEEEHISNIALTGFLSTNVCSHVHKQTVDVVIEVVHYYNNTVAVDNVATLEKQYDVLSNFGIESNEDSDFDDDALQETY